MSEKPREMTDDEIEDLVNESRIEGYFLHMDWPQTAPGAPGCWFGGDPNLPPDIEWPSYGEFINDEDEAFEPMLFLAQVNCAELPVIEHRPEIPQSGTLFFFHDVSFYSGDDAHKGTVIYVDEDVSNYPSRVPPKIGKLAHYLAEYFQLYDEDRLDEGRLRLDRWPMLPQLHYVWAHRRMNLDAKTQHRYTEKWSELTYYEIEDVKAFSKQPISRPFSKHRLFCDKSTTTKIDDPDWIQLAYFSAKSIRANFGTNDVGLSFDVRKRDACNRDFGEVLIGRGD